METKETQPKPSTDRFDFVALDLETATEERNSICEVGVAVVESGRMTERRSWLVRPPYNEYSAFNTYIHGITPKDTAKCPPFKKVWPEILPYLQGRTVVAHNTSFDMYVLRDTFTANGLEWPEFYFYCSYRIGRRIFMNTPNHKLGTLCRLLGIETGNAHRAGDDAVACACLFLCELERAEAESIADLQEKLRFRCGEFGPGVFRPQLQNDSGKGRKKPHEKKTYEGDPSKFDEGNYFYGKNVCFTGKCRFGTRDRMSQMVADIGGRPCPSVTSATDVLVVGEQDYRAVGGEGLSSKQRTAMRIIEEGGDIEILSEADFLTMI